MKTSRILFIGNSHTYLHYMPRMLEQLARAAGYRKRLRTEQVTGRGAGLEWHWNNPATRHMITDGQWDYVILQERSGGPLEDPVSMQKHARLLDAEIRQRSQQILKIVQERGPFRAGGEYFTSRQRSYTVTDFASLGEALSRSGMALDDFQTTKTCSPYLEMKPLRKAA